MSEKSPFPAGFERDGRLILLAHNEKLINRKEARNNLLKLGLDLEEEYVPDPEDAPAGPRPDPANLMGIDGDEDHVVDISNMRVYNVQTGAFVGIFEKDEDEDEELDLVPDVESPGIVIPAEIEPELARPNPQDDEQVDGGEPA